MENNNRSTGGIGLVPGPSLVPHAFGYLRTRTQTPVTLPVAKTPGLIPAAGVYSARHLRVLLMGFERMFPDYDDRLIVCVDEMMLVRITGLNWKDGFGLVIEARS